MSDHNYYSPEAINARATERKQQDFTDLQNELAGRETGKVNRFTTEEERAKRSGRASEAQRQKQHEQITLAMMLETPEYSALYNDTMNALNDTETSVYDALVDTADKIGDASKALEEAEKNGASEEELERLRKEYKDAQERHRKMLEHEARLREIRDRMEDKDYPPAPEELEGFKKELDGIKSEANISIESKQSLDTAPEQQTTVTEKLDLSGFSPV